MVNKDLSVAAIKQDLTTRFIGQNIIYYTRIQSTMDAARREVQRGASEGTVVIAGQQTRGRGRLKRTWFSPGGNIALSVILYPDVVGLPYLVMIASLAAVRSLENVTGLKIQIKWPNDILIKGKKVAGILIENEFKNDKVAYAIIGIGINVALRHNDVSEISDFATGLEEELGFKISHEEIVKNLFTEFEHLYLKLPDSDDIFTAWQARLITLGQEVKATCGKETLEGIAESIDESGALIIRTNNGALTRVVAGDVTLREK